MTICLRVKMERSAIGHAHLKGTRLEEFARIGVVPAFKSALVSSSTKVPSFMISKRSHIWLLPGVRCNTYDVVYMSYYDLSKIGMACKARRMT
ncbi:hypothetical protein FBZ99_105310 [Rhizobium sp. ERR 1071]|nr:hypothetical protein FBZ99_105310 [Rhizobium sp. ERR1071]